MRVTLVRPPFIGKRFGPPTGLAYLGGVLKEAGHQVAVVDLNALMDERHYEMTDYTRDFILRPGHPAVVDGWARLDEFSRAIVDTDPEVVGFSLSYPTFDYGIILARQLPRGIRRIAGGPQATYHPDKLLDLGIFSAVVPGFGEEAVVRALSEDGVVEAPLERGRDYAPDYSGFDLAAYDGRLSVVTSRGCPNRCTFCTQQLAFVRHSVDSVVDQLDGIHGVRELMFNDSNLNADEGRMVELFGRLAPLGLPPSHVFGLQVRRRYAEYAHLMAAAGVREVRLGIESGSPRERASMNKPRFDNDLVVDMVRELTRHGITTWTQFIFAYPDQTEDDRDHTLDLMRRLNRECDPRFVRHFWYRFMVHHGTEALFRERYGVTLDSPSTWSNAVYTPAGVVAIAQRYQAVMPDNARLFT